MTYQQFRDKAKAVLEQANGPLTWTEVRTAAALPQLFPNNIWVRRLEEDIGLLRSRDGNRIIRWTLRR